MSAGLRRIVARATSTGQFGYRTVVYEAGYNEQQKKWIGIYKSIRPDVNVSKLAASTVYARATAQTAKSEHITDSNLFVGNDEIIDAPRVFLAVNGNSQGKCGNTNSCNVTMEFTYSGAIMALTARSGAIALPVYFEADVSFMQPEFEGSVTCKFENGFSVKGRSDVKDGAIIYDGDVSNKINYNAIENGSCDYQIIKGNNQSAAYYAIKNLYDNYLNLKMQRAAKSRDEKDRYRKYVNEELAYHASRSQNTNFDFWSIGTWTTTLGNLWGPVTSIVIGGARSFYWHTRIEDTTTTESVNFTTRIKESNIESKERVSFDGFTLVCWKKDGLNSVLAACPSVSIATYQAQADTDLGKNQEMCLGDSVSADCLKDAKEHAKEIETDVNGVIVDAWAA